MLCDIWGEVKENQDSRRGRRLLETMRSKDLLNVDQLIGYPGVIPAAGGYMHPVKDLCTIAMGT